MPPTPVPPEVDEFLRQPNHAVVATLRPDGSPHTAVVWYLWRDGRVVLNMEDTRMRLRWMQRDPRLALSAIDPGNFYRHVSLLGRVSEVRPDRDMSIIDEMAEHYTGAAYADRGATRVAAWMDVDSWHGFDPEAYRVLGVQGRPGHWEL